MPWIINLILDIIDWSCRRQNNPSPWSIKSKTPCTEFGGSGHQTRPGLRVGRSGCTGTNGPVIPRRDCCTLHRIQARFKSPAGSQTGVGRNCCPPFRSNLQIGRLGLELGLGLGLVRGVGLGLGLQMVAKRGSGSIVLQSTGFISRWNSNLQMVGLVSRW